jgi:hypothetical protein
MTLQEMVTAVQGAFGSRFQDSTSLVLQYLDTVQKVALNRDMRNFMWWNDYLTINTAVVLSASGFTSWVAGDVGKVLSSGTATGTIISYNNTTRTAQVTVLTGTTFSGAVTTTAGTGGGTFSSQAVSKGPYSWASLTPNFGSLTPYSSSGSAGVRRMLGVTTATDSELYGETNLALLNDYNFILGTYDKRAIFEIVTKYDMQKVLFFVDTPDTTENLYRWVYYIRPPTLGLVTDDNNVLIPSEFHQTVMVEGAQALADRSTYGDRTPEQVLAQIIQPFWDMNAQAYTPDGANNNMTSEGQL